MDAQQPHYPRDDEIDLFELAGKLYQQKAVIILCTLVTGLIAVFVALMLPKIYSAKAVISQSSYAEFQKLNANILYAELQKLNASIPELSDLSGIHLPDNLTITPKAAYNQFERHLTSQPVQRQAFEYSLPARKSTTEAERASAYDAFTKSLKIALEKKSNTPRITITYESQDPQLAANIINHQLINISLKNTIASLQTNYNNLIETTITALQIDIKTLEASFTASNQLEVTQLKESYAQAEAAGITSFSESVANVSSGNRYLLGTALLQSTINEVEKRKNTYRLYNDDSTELAGKPYIPGVAQRAILIDQLNQMYTDFSSIKPVNIEQEALVPAISIKPGKKLIVALGIILGGILGTFIALIRIALNDRKKRLFAANTNFRTS